MSAQIFNLGKLRFYFKGAYSGSTTYQINDVVKYNNDVYVYINAGATSGNTPTVTAYWSKMIEGFTDPADGVADDFIYTDGTTFQFRQISEVPSQTGADGKFLKTNGTEASWSNSFGELGVTGDLTVGVKNTKTISNKALTSNVATLTTSVAHNFAAGESVVIAGVDATFNGTYTIVATPTATTFTYSKTASNVTSTVATGTASISYIGELYVGNGAIEDATILGTNVANVITKSLTSNVATITTDANHGFSPYQFVTVDLTPADAAFDGTYEIISCPTPYQFTYAKTTGNISSQATLGTVSALTGYTNPVAVFAVDADDYAQIAFRNSNNSANSSTDVILYPDNGTDFSGYIDMGVTSSGFNDPEFTITGPNDGYIFMTAPANTTGAGNLILATGDLGSENKIVFAAGGLGSNNTQMSITPDVNVHIEIATPSTSSTTGALTVVGGVGVQGDMNIEGDVAIVGSISFGGGSTTSANLSVTSPVIFSNDGATTNNNDTGFVGEYVSSGTKYTGIVRDHTDGVWKLFTGLSTKPTTTTAFGSSTLADLSLGSLTASGSVTVTGGLTISGTSDLQEMREVIVPVTISTNIATCDWTAGNIYYIGTAPSANYAVALTNVPTDNNRVMTINLIVATSGTSYSPTGTFSINGTTVVPKYAAGIAPAGTATSGRFDVFTYTLIRVSSSWTVFGSANVNYY